MICKFDALYTKHQMKNFITDDQLIGKIRQNLTQIQTETSKNTLIEIPLEASLLLKNRLNVDSPKEYQRLVQKQTESGVNLLEDIDLSCYQRPWGKLEHELKINRAMQFVQEQISLHGLSKVQSKQLRILLVKAINKRLITKKSDVVYDTEQGKLIQIYNLKFDKETGLYHIDVDKFVPNPEKEENGYISHVSTLPPNLVSQLFGKS